MPVQETNRSMIKAMIAAHSVMEYLDETLLHNFRSTVLLTYKHKLPLHPCT